MIDELYKERFINTYTKTPIEIENIIKDLKCFLSGILNFQKGIKINKTKPILREAINMGGTELFNANLATGNALP